ncbi:MAG: energy-coupling factor transporter transmembrane component T [Clostridia bacterium]|nr:energy-coupling factor transporter transmembrane component T [Clostridia bacterium]MDR3645795.1 energy-coupling factor transporter transmembrane component T [Clostridia bacterium]
MNKSEKSYVSSLYPITKLVFVACLIVSVFFLYNYIYDLVCFAAMVAIAASDGKGKAYIKTILKTIFILIVLIFLMQSFLHSGTHVLWHWGILTIHKEGIWYAINLSTTLLVIGGAIALLFKITEVEDLIHSLENSGMSPRATYVILSTLQIIPQMKMKSAVIMDAQRSRGVETEGNLMVRIKAFFPSLAPLVLSSIVGTEERAITLEARAFTANVKKTCLDMPQDSKHDKVLRIVLLVLLGILIVGRIILWIL